MYKEILNHLDSILYLADREDYSLVYLNKAGKDAIGIHEEDESYRDKKCYEVLQGMDRPCPFCTNSLLKEGKYYAWEHYNPLVKEYFFVKDTLLEFEGRWLRMEVADEATKRVEERKSLVSMLEMETALIQCVHTLAGHTDLQEALEIILSVVGDYYGGDRAYIFEINYENRLFSNTYEWCRKGVTREIEKLQSIPIDYIEVWLNEFRKRGEFFLTRLGQLYSEGTDAYTILESQGIDSLVAAPLMAAGKIIGFIGVDNPCKNVEDLELLRSVTYFIINDLEKRRYLSELENISYMDTLTGVFNRNHYNEIIKKLQEKPPVKLGTVYTDINGLKEANDTYGHSHGDMLIITLSRILKECFEANICRIGGDEFAVFCPNMEQSEFEQRLDLFQSKLRTEKVLSASVGSSYSCQSGDVNKQIAEADKQMYQNKKEFYRQRGLQGDI